MRFFAVTCVLALWCAPVQADSITVSLERVLDDLGMQQDYFDRLSPKGKAGVFQEWKDFQNVSRSSFRDASTHALALVLEASVIWDVKTTFDARRRSSDIKEWWFPMKPFVSKGPAISYPVGLALGGCVAYGLDVAAKKMWKRHHGRNWLRARRIAPVLYAGAHVATGFHNAGLARP